jgi:hypothetical protein
MISALWNLREDVLGVAGGSLLVIMFEAPYSLHTHTRSSLYIHKVFQHLLLWLQVIRLQSCLILLLER